MKWSGRIRTGRNVIQINTIEPIGRKIKEVNNMHLNEFYIFIILFIIVCLYSA